MGQPTTRWKWRDALARKSCRRAAAADRPTRETWERARRLVCCCFFIDDDVCVHKDTIARVLTNFRHCPTLDALILLATTCAILYQVYFLAPIFALLFLSLGSYWIDGRIHPGNRAFQILMTTILAVIVVVGYHAGLLQLVFPPICLGYLLLFPRHRYSYSTEQRRRVTGLLCGTYVAVAAVFIFSLLPLHLPVFCLLFLPLIIAALNLQFYVFLAQRWDISTLWRPSRSICCITSTTASHSLPALSGTAAGVSSSGGRECPAGPSVRHKKALWARLIRMQHRAQAERWRVREIDWSVGPPIRGKIDRVVAALPESRPFPIPSGGRHRSSGRFRAVGQRCRAVLHT